MTTIVPTAVATCAALGDGCSPSGVNLQHKAARIKRLVNNELSNQHFTQTHKIPKWITRKSFRSSIIKRGQVKQSNNSYLFLQNGHFPLKVKRKCVTIRIKGTSVHSMQKIPRPFVR